MCQQIKKKFFKLTEWTSEKPTYLHKAYQNQSDIVSHSSQERIIDSVVGTYSEFKNQKEKKVLYFLSHINEQ